MFLCGSKFIKKFWKFEISGHWEGIIILANQKGGRIAMKFLLPATSWLLVKFVFTIIDYKPFKFLNRCFSSLMEAF